jgi:hypothetical protein
MAPRHRHSAGYDGDVGDGRSVAASGGKFGMERHVDAPSRLGQCGPRRALLQGLVVRHGARSKN